MKKVKILDKEFSLSIPAETILAAVKKIATEINNDYNGQSPMFLGVLNGVFMFASDFMKEITLETQITFIKMASYSGTKSTGTVNELIGLSDSVEGKPLIIIEDIIDTGNTIEKLMEILPTYKPSEIKIATLLYKPEAYKKNIKIDYIGLEIPNDFIVGYGLDYDGYGRNLPDIYTLIPE
jgi:hypoxanthine phosphoribosyltransferase